MDMNSIEIIRLYQSQIELTDKIWGYFATVSLAALGAIGIGGVGKSRMVLLMLAIGYLVFAAGSWISLRNSHEDAVAIGQLMKQVEVGKEVGTRFTPLSTRWVLFFHACLAIAVVVVLGVVGLDTPGSVR